MLGVFNFFSQQQKGIEREKILVVEIILDLMRNLRFSFVKWTSTFHNLVNLACPNDI